MRRRWPLLVALAALLVVAWLMRSAWLAVRSEEGTFHPERGAVPRPTSLEGLDGLADASFATSDGLRLEGWWLPSKNGAAIVLAHGSNADRRDLLTEARALTRSGFGVLVYDQPGHGESQGTVTLGATEVASLGAALDFVSARPGVDSKRLGAVGLSSGGAIVALAAAKDTRLRAIALIATYTDYEDHLAWEYRSSDPITRRAALSPGRRTITGRLRPIEAVETTRARAVFLIGGEYDPTVPASMAPLLDGRGQGRSADARSLDRPRRTPPSLRRSDVRRLR